MLKSLQQWFHIDRFISFFLQLTNYERRTSNAVLFLALTCSLNHFQMARWKSKVGGLAFRKARGLKSRGAPVFACCQKSLAVQGVAFRVELDAQDIAKRACSTASMILPSSEVAVTRRSAPSLPIAWWWAVATKGWSVLEKPQPAHENAVFAQADAMERRTSAACRSEQLFQVDARMDLVGTGCQDLLHRFLRHIFRLGCPGSVAAGGHVQALRAEADGQDGKILAPGQKRGESRDFGCRPAGGKETKSRTSGAPGSWVR